jgi:SAM-dependent methyltransferase
MDHRYLQTPRRSRRPAERLNVRDRFEWTRAPGVGPPLSTLGDLTGKQAIEVGCGGGHNLAHLVVHHGCRAVGVDHDLAQIERARRLYGTIPGLTFVHADAATYLHTIPRVSADLCLSIFGAFSFADLRPLAAGAARVLRPEGLLALTIRSTESTDLVLILARS